MKENQAFDLLQSAVNDLIAGDESAITSVLRALRMLGLDLETEQFLLDSVNDAIGVAVGNQINRLLTQDVVPLPEDLENKLSTILEALTPRNFDQTKQRLIRIFLSSPGDVSEERALAMKVINNLPYTPLLRGRVAIETIAWDKPGAKTPMLATLSPQEAINQGLPKPSDCDIVITIFWSRMGTPLNEEYRKPESFWFENGARWEDWRYLSGTEWEYVDAVQQANQTGRPLVIVYRRTEDPKVSLRDADRDEKISQYELVESFFDSFTDEHGVAKRGINLYEAPSDFESQLESHLQDLIARILYESDSHHQILAEVETAPLWQGSPFPGLRAFSTEDAPIFFGRGSETDDLVKRLRAQNFLAVVGASGSGKSSLVGAGLLPRLAENAIPGSQDWRIIRFTPDEQGAGDPFISLVAALQTASIAANISPRELQNNPETFTEICSSALSDRPNWAKVLIFIDQFEELFTRVGLPDRKSFIDMLNTTLQSNNICVVVTLRADFYNRALEFKALENLIKPGTFPLYPPKRDALREMIERPAERAGLSFEPGLVRLILDETGDDPGGLALLAFALQQIYDEREENKLTYEAYERSGGVQGSIGQQAQSAFDALDQETQGALPMVFRELVAMLEDGTPTRRRANLKTITFNSASERLVQQLTEKRLLVQGRGENDNSIVEVAHEALFRSWPTLRDWIAEVADDLSYGSQISNDTQEWENNDHQPDYLLRGAQLERASEWRIRAGMMDLMNTQQENFIQASQSEWQKLQAEESNRQHREVRRLKWFVCGLAFFLLIAFFFAFLANRNAQQAEQRTLEAQAMTLAAQAQLELINGNRTLSMLLAMETLNNFPYSVQAEQALYDAIDSGPLPRLMITENCSKIFTAVWSPDSRLIVTTPKGNSAHVYDAKTGKEIFTLEGHKDDVWFTVFSPDGKKILTASADNTAKIWDAQTGKEILTLIGHGSDIMDTAWSPDGSQILTGSIDQDAKVWDAKTGVNLFTLVGHKWSVNHVAWSPDGSYILTVSGDDTAKIWNAQTGEEVLTFSENGTTISNGVWSPDGSHILTISGDDTAKIWNAQTGEEVLTFSENGTTISNGVWSPDGNRVLIIFYNHVKIWDIKTGEEIATLNGHSSDISTAIWDLQGEKILTASSDKTVRVWDSNTGAEILNISRQTGDFWTVAWSPEENRILTGASDGTAQIWNAQTGEEILAFLGHRSGIDTAVWSPDGKYILTKSRDHDKTIRIWDANTQTSHLILDAPESISESTYWSPDGSQILVISSSNAYVRDSQTGTEIISLRKNQDEVKNAVWSPNGDRILTVSSDNTIKVWDTRTSNELVELNELDDIVDKVIWEPNGKRVLIIFAEHTAQIFDSQTGEDLLNLSGHTWGIREAVWSPDGSKICSLGRINPTAWIWDSKTGEKLLTLDEVGTASWSPDGNRIFTTSYNNAQIWDAKTGKILKNLEGHPNIVSSAGWSPDGNFVLTISYDIAQVWDVKTGQQILTLIGHEDDINSAVWSPNGDRILTDSDDNTVRIWDSQTGAELHKRSGFRNPVWSPDGSRILVRSTDGLVEIWPMWQSWEAAADYLQGCCLSRKLTEKEREQFGLPTTE